MNKPTNQQLLKVALEFNSLVRDSVGPEKWRKICELNRAARSWSTCATGDFCDSNIWMARAIQTVLGIKHIKPESQAHSDIWNRAWDMAKTIMCVERPRVIVIVDGGVVQGACSNVEDLDVEVLDWDNAKDGGCEPDELKRYAALDKECGTMHDVY